VAAATLASSREAQSQAQAIVGEGALDLLLPTGARNVGLGQASTALRGSTESVWGNPSGLASITSTTAALHHSRSAGGKADAVSVVAHSRLLGSFGVSASLRELGPSDNTDASGAEGGTILPRSLIYAATYAAGIDKLNVGLTYKLVQFRLDCTGPCSEDTGVMGSTSAVDAGAQFSLAPFIPVTIGASVRNVGLRMQVNDGPQADDLPSRLQAGMEVRISKLDEVVDGAQLTLNADMISELGRMDPSPRLGAELAWQRRFHVRGGYASRSAGYGGPSLGVGYEGSSLAIDFARLFDEVSSFSGNDPIYLSMRYRF
jgi:hypothetical protein